MGDKKIITIAGTKLNEEGTTKLHTLVCGCGTKYIRAAKESSLNYYRENPKYTAQCCKEQFKYLGEVEWNGNEIVGETPAAEVPVVETPEVHEEVALSSLAEKLEPVVVPEATETPSDENKKPALVDINTLVKPGRKGVTNAQMITAIKDNKDSEDNLKILFEAYPEVFISSAKYVKDEIKAAAEKVIKGKRPDASILMGTKMRKKVEGEN